MPLGVPLDAEVTVAVSVTLWPGLIDALLAVSAVLLPACEMFSMPFCVVTV